jgi:acyl dehydratase
MARFTGNGEMNYRVRGKTFEEFKVGDEIVSGARTITETDVVNFACLSGDFHPEHMNDEYAKKGVLGERIAHGLLVLSIAIGLLNQTGVLEGTTIAVREMGIRFLKAVKFGDTIRAVQRIENKQETGKPDRGILKSLLVALNQEDQVVLEADIVLLVYRNGWAPPLG